MKFKTVTALALFALIGCVSETAPSTGRADRYLPSQVVFSGDLGDYVVFQPITRTFDAAGIMHVTVPIRANTTLGDLTVDYKFTYFDENHVPIDVPTAQETITLHANAFEYIQGNATTPRARDFQITLRDAN